ncbi:MAG: ABC transporter ATP-binding protein, partial [Gammaproteobacteria bacterium]
MIIQACQVYKRVQSGEHMLPILHDINLSIHAGESIAITGASGSGKSTLLGLLAGLDTPTSGNIILRGKDLTTLNEDGRALLRAKHVGFVFQSFQLLPSLTALENVMLPFELAQVDSPREKARLLLRRVGLAQREHHYPRQLSGGEQQRVAIARAFAAEPSILFADELTGNLDKQTGQHIIDVLFTLNAEQKTTLVLVTHDDNLAQRCQR